MPFYTYSQNNSGGSFTSGGLSEGLTRQVIIEASDVDDANSRAENLGIYFDGVDNGMDCPCCGDRWVTPWDEADVPSIHRIPVADYYNLNSEMNAKYPYLARSWGVNPKGDAVVYYLDGREEWFDYASS